MSPLTWGNTHNGVSTLLCEALWETSLSTVSHCLLLISLLDGLMPPPRHPMATVQEASSYLFRVHTLSACCFTHRPPCWGCGSKPSQSSCLRGPTFSHEETCVSQSVPLAINHKSETCYKSQPPSAMARVTTAQPGGICSAEQNPGRAWPLVENLPQRTPGTRPCMFPALQTLRGCEIGALRLHP